MSTPFDLLSAARDLIATPSVSSLGNEAVLKIIETLMLRCGLQTRRFADASEGPHPAQANLLAAPPGNPGDDGGLLLVTHSDTVDPGDPKAWTATGGDPFKLTQAGDRLYGLGSADVKLDLLSKLLALHRVRDRRLGRPVHLLCTYAEEVGLVGARAFMKAAPIHHAFASAGEPSELRIIHAHKGYLVVRLLLEDKAPARRAGPPTTKRFEGVSAHSSTPQLGDSAIERLLDSLHEAPGPLGPTPDQGVTRSRGGIKTSPDQVRAALGGGGVAMASGGEVANRVADNCLLELGGEGPDGSSLLAAAARLRAHWCRRVQAMEPALDARFDPPHSVYNLGRLRLGPSEGSSTAEASGVEAELLFDCRLLPGQNGEQTAALFEADVASTCKALGLDFRCEVDRASRALEAPPEGPLIQAAAAAARKVGTDPSPMTKATSTEAGMLASAGAQAMVFGPGLSIGNVHKPNEYNLLSQLERAVDFYEALIQELCLQP